MKNTLTDSKEWFEDWFDSKFYHILYKNRDYSEAKKFIDNLLSHLNPKKDAVFCDVACGKGRHSIYINKMGYTIDGFDLSENSILSAKDNQSENLHFYVNDIRIPLKVETYDYAFNLFTSFGYFEDENDNQKSIDAIATSLKKNGLLVLDFMNCNKVIKNLTQTESKTMDGIQFNINKSVINNYITKDISFNYNDTYYNFQEKVKLITKEAFKSYFDAANLKIEGIFGDYNLNPFDIDSSDRLILVARKK
ncbi:class I SAM-dependent methyltransferase [Vicingaceae bacterium]|nr:class I SAM-dependent methyltransferase [Vicingaceae bacterium]